MVKPVPAPSSSSGNPDLGLTTLAIRRAVWIDVGMTAPTPFLSFCQPLKNCISSSNLLARRCFSPKTISSPYDGYLPVYQRRAISRTDRHSSPFGVSLAALYFYQSEAEMPALRTASPIVVASSAVMLLARHASSRAMSLMLRLLDSQRRHDFSSGESIVQSL